MNTGFEWIDSYTKIANALLAYKTRQLELLRFIYGMFSEMGINNSYLQDKHDGTSMSFKKIDPFTVIGIFNRNNTAANRITIINYFINFLKIDVEAPANFDGIPVLNAMLSWFFGGKEYDRSTHIDKLWELFETAIKLADSPSAETETQFVTLFDFVISQPCSKWMTTMGLFWIRPYKFITLDGNTRTYLTNEIGLGYKFNKLPNGKQYLAICADMQNKINSNKHINSFPALSQAAWVKAQSTEETVSYWLGGATYGSEDMSEEFIANGVYAIGFGEEDISNIVSNQTELKRWIANLPELSTRKAFGFLCQMKPEDMIALKSAYAKGTISMLRIKAIGTVIGSLSSGYQYDERLGHTLPVEWQAIVPNIDYEIGGYLKTIHSVTKKQDIDTIFRTIPTVGETANDEIGYYSEIIEALKSLGGKGLWREICDKIEERDNLSNVRTTKSWRHIVSAYMQYKCGDSPKFQGKENLFWWNKETQMWGLRDYVEPVTLSAYTKADFLSEVYMITEKYDDIVALIERKKNIILQGAPGVGKSYLAKRLAYSVLGLRDANKVEMVQFHQSYSYEDFIEGFRPSASGNFEIRQGVFYRFCEKAKNDSANKYFFIIDEINRGNLSKIMGELMLLLENDKRGEEFAMPLTYSGEQFYVSENIYLIGTMNTADRSLAMLDYALRRRFSFVPIEPAFENERFIADFRANYADADIVIEKIKKLNNLIKTELDGGHQIGHSYFCSGNPLSKGDIDGVFKYEIEELLREYFFDNESKLDEALKLL